ncbi:MULTISPECIES: hypothetical protein [unclassified Rhodococcus (in: high G+C Gram-positive bacteria)]|uniref:hypothetical protein n=1 Tax=unclassified Rhodococcus (in: high G+C Gram-positive bacteria) TaxID=192944 RepID=UPI0006F27F10|nr:MULTISPECIES: hypothetical protein [unclassified Rhodococcus (in: high G+C Gram-positive bacteria)]KQU30305.1 hypothetical protein ASG69_04405 [Rhodococcus sp. Leaf225]KQU44790.1 hypothetical protein ASH03_12735 [Rhodococcus sp. Leaf258]
MALADRFPQLSGEAVDTSWLPALDATADDLIQSARKSLLSAVHRFSPSASLPLHVDLRLIGPSVTGGSLPASAAPVIAYFQQEVLAAAASQAVEFSLQGISEGSAIVHLAPIFASSRPNSEIGLPQVSEVESAIAKVLSIHDRLEDESPPNSFAAEKRSLMDRLSDLTNSLRDNDLALSVTASGSQGSVRESHLSKRGINWAAKVFDSLQDPPSRRSISGLIAAVDIEGSVVVRGGPRNGRIQIQKVPTQLITDQTLVVGKSVTMEIDELADVDGMGHRKVRARNFVSLADQLEAEAD